MISRVWRGWASPAHADEYERLLVSTILPGIASRGIAGYRGAYLYRRADGASVEFMTTMMFDSIEAVIGFAGADYEIAVVPEVARRLLERFDARSAHYEVVLARG
ncbi:MAG: antibiotic biosynthesis monooxygenase [Gemmatimonadota bacterium]